MPDLLNSKLQQETLDRHQFLISLWKTPDCDGGIGRLSLVTVFVDRVAGNDNLSPEDEILTSGGIVDND